MTKDEGKEEGTTVRTVFVTSIIVSEMLNAQESPLECVMCRTRADNTYFNQYHYLDTDINIIVEYMMTIEEERLELELPIQLSISRCLLIINKISYDWFLFPSKFYIEEPFLCIARLK